MADPALPSHAFKARIVPGASVSGRNFGSTLLRPGMRVTAEIVVGDRSVLEYLLSPVVRTVDEAGEES
jgi:multidrug efflux pump subunit AcrA (membrane-fusion protein)